MDNNCDYGSDSSLNVLKSIKDRASKADLNRMTSLVILGSTAQLPVDRILRSAIFQFMDYLVQPC